MLDVARQTYKEATNDTYDHVTALNEKYSLNIKVVFSTSNGFQLSIPVDQTPADEPLPSEFLNVVKRGKSYSFTTLKVLGFNDRIQESLTEVYLMSDKTISELVDDVRTRIKCLYSLSEAVALLDMLMRYSR